MFIFEKIIIIHSYVYICVYILSIFLYFNWKCHRKYSILYYLNRTTFQFLLKRKENQKSV